MKNFKNIYGKKMTLIQQFKNFIYSIISIIFIVVLLTGCAESPEQKQIIKESKKRVKIKLEGVVKPYASYNLLAPVTGEVKEIFVKEGDWVNKGDKIYIIKSELLDIDIQNLKDDIKQIDHEMGLTRRSEYKEISSREALIQAAKAKLDRVSSLYAEHCATKAEVEIAEEKYFNLFNTKEAVREKFNTQRSSLLKERKSKMAELRKLEYVKNHTLVKAPISGFFISSKIIVDQEVQKGSTIAKILDLRRVVVRAGIASGLFQFIHENDKVSIDFITTPPYHKEAVISKIIPIVDPKIGRMVVEINLDNPNYLLQDGTKALITIKPKGEAQKEIYKYFYKKGSSVIEIKTGIK